VRIKVWKMGSIIQSNTRQQTLCSLPDAQSLRNLFYKAYILYEKHLNLDANLFNDSLHT
jgi:hypothetical protein